MAVNVLFELLVAHAPIPGPSLYYRNCSEFIVADGFVCFWFLFFRFSHGYLQCTKGSVERNFRPRSCRRCRLASKIGRYFDILGRRLRGERFRRFMENVTAPSSNLKPTVQYMFYIDPLYSIFMFYFFLIIIIY